MWVTRLEGWVNQKNPCFGKIVQIVIRASLISSFSVTHVEKANETLAIKTLLVTNELFRSEMKNNDILVQFENTKHQTRCKVKKTNLLPYLLSTLDGNSF